MKENLLLIINPTAGSINVSEVMDLVDEWSNKSRFNIETYKTSGNNDTHIILRGGKEPNYDKDSINETLIALREAEVNESIMIDASHGNSQKQFKRQLPVIEEISEQIISGNNSIKGVMIESHLVEGNQKISDSLTYGQSITDACIGWEDTVSSLKNLSDAVEKRRGS